MLRRYVWILPVLCLFSVIGADDGEEERDIMEVLYAKAKVNLTLNVLGRRPNGYHDLELIFQPVSLADEIHVEESGDEEMHFTCTVAAFANEKNLAWRAWTLMKEHFPEQVHGLRVHLIKKIPSGAGMAGGSTDASALILWMNEHFCLGLSIQEMIDLGVKLGADVPPCMMEQATIGRGVGEILTAIETPESLSEYPLLLLKPEASFNTGEMFHAIDAHGYEDQKNPNLAMIAAMEAGDLAGMAANLYNVFEEAVPERKLIRELKQDLLAAGALGSLMTGSGSVVYGIFADKTSRDLAFLRLRNRQELQVICCEAVNRPNPWKL